MAFILDQLLAIVVGAMLIVTLLTLQFRERQAAISNTIGHTVRKTLNETMEPVADDIENMWSPDKAGGGVVSVDTFTSGPYVGHGITRFVQFPAEARFGTSDANRAMAQVTYQLYPTGTTANVSGEIYEQFGLVRTVDFSAFSASSGYNGPTLTDTLAPLLIDFKVGYIEGLNSGSTMRRTGAPTDLTHAVHLSALGARPAPDSTITGRATRIPFNAVPYGKTYRLLNF